MSLVAISSELIEAKLSSESDFAAFAGFCGGHFAVLVAVMVLELAWKCEPVNIASSSESTMPSEL